jgi:ABC-type transport system involved in multi-copper enzyme maturation permease subunit
MKIIEIIRFELLYRSKRPVNYIYFVILFSIALLFSKLGIKGITDASVQVKENAPLIIHQLTALLNLPLLLLTSAIMGVAVIRDYDCQMEQLIFTNPITKKQYLTGRFIGSFITMLILSLAIPLGAIAGELSSTKPAADFLPFSAANYFLSYLIIVLPNTFFLGALYFAGGAISKKAVVIYTQGIMLLIIISIVDEGVIETSQNLELATLFDYYTLQLFNLQTKYWSAAEINTQMVPFSSALIINRLIYLGLGALALALTFWRFQTTKVQTTQRSSR